MTGGKASAFLVIIVSGIFFTIPPDEESDNVLTGCC